jgi:hypothetical protein|tara:strand:+ start:482 stop:868 length:387 start_codon:yes stop_codon:yes gene_type:complete
MKRFILMFLALMGVFALSVIGIAGDFGYFDDASQGEAIAMVVPDQVIGDSTGIGRADHAQFSQAALDQIVMQDPLDGKARGPNPSMTNDVLWTITASLTTTERSDKTAANVTFTTGDHSSGIPLDLML